MKHIVSLYNGRIKFDRKDNLMEVSVILCIAQSLGKAKFSNYKKINVDEDYLFYSYYFYVIIYVRF